MPMAPTGRCWICGGSHQERVYRSPFDLSPLPRFGPYAHCHHPDGWLVACRDCGFGQPEAMPDLPDYFDTLYQIDWNRPALDREFEVGYKDFIFGSVLEGISRRIAPGVPRTILDIGTHAGKFLQMAREAGWEAEGAELNPVTAAYAAERTGLPVHQVPAQELAAQGRRYGALTMTDVLEHIPRPATLVAELRELVHPGGVIAVKVPHGPMQVFKEVFRRDVLRASDAGVMTRFVHVNHFSVGSLRLCLESAGFREVTVEVGAPEFIPPSPARTRNEGRKAGLVRAVYEVARRIPGSVHTPLGLHLQSYAVA